MQNNNLYKIIATSGGVGYIPFAPGTFGALVGFIICYALSLCCSDMISFIPILIFSILLSYWLGIVSSHKLIPEWGEDPQRIVIDETCGYFISLLFLTPNLFNLIGAFILFRFFDIVKPFGIRKIEDFKSKSHAIMLDDVVAGFAACILLHIINVIKQII